MSAPTPADDLRAAYATIRAVRDRLRRSQETHAHADQLTAALHLVEGVGRALAQLEPRDAGRSSVAAGHPTRGETYRARARVLAAGGPQAVEPG